MSKKGSNIINFWIVFWTILLLISGYLIYKDRYRIVNIIHIQEPVKKKLVQKPIEKKKKVIIPNSVYVMSMSHVDIKQKKMLQNKIVNWLTKTYGRMYKQLAIQISEYLINNSKMPILLIGLAGAESSFIVQNTSSASAYGLCQIRYSIWKKECPDIMKSYGIISYKELYDPIKNLKMAEYILTKYLKEANGNIYNALVRYQSGAKSILKLKPKKRRTTRKYINKIFSICGKLYVYITLNTEG